MAQRTVSPCRPRELASSRQKNTGDTHSAPMTNPNVIELGGASKFTFRLARAPRPHRAQPRLSCSFYARACFTSPGHKLPH